MDMWNGCIDVKTYCLIARWGELITKNFSNLICNDSELALVLGMLKPMISYYILNVNQ